MTALLALLLAAGPLGPDDGAPPALPAKRPQAQEEAPPRPVPPPDQEAAPLLKDDLGGGLLDLDWLELHVRLGLADFTDDFRIDPTFQVSLVAHAPMPFLSPSSDPGGDYFGALLGVTLIPGVERDLNPAPSGADGSIFLIHFGLDYTVVRNQSLYFAVEAGGQYASYGGIADLEDGLGLFGGVNGGVHIGSGLTLGAAAEIAFVDDSQRIHLFSLDLVIEF
jgi:hypothetical protein